MAQLGAGVYQHRHQRAETLFQGGIAIHIDHIHDEAELTAQRIHPPAHLIAQVAVAAAIKGKPQPCSVRFRRSHGGLLAVQAFDRDEALILASAHVQGDRGGFVYGV